MPEQERSETNPAEAGPSRDLPEAFTKNAEEGEQIKEIYDRGGASREKRTSTGLNVVDEGSADSFPASDPPAEMGSSSTIK